VSGKGSGRVSVAGWVCLKRGARGHLFYRMLAHSGRESERRRPRSGKGTVGGWFSRAADRYGAQNILICSATTVGGR
jgi:hypothetical protein